MNEPLCEFGSLQSGEIESKHTHTTHSKIVKNFQEYN